jgi:hypothetical protein
VGGFGGRLKLQDFLCSMASNEAILKGAKERTNGAARLVR